MKTQTMLISGKYSIIKYRKQTKIRYRVIVDRNYYGERVLKTFTNRKAAEQFVMLLSLTQ